MLLLLVIPLGLLWFLISVHRERLGFGNLSVRGAFVLAFLAFEVLLLGITELTSVGHHFTAGTVAVAWLIVIIVLLFAARTQITLVVQRDRSDDGARFGLVNRAKRLTGEDRFWVAVLTAIFGLLVAEGTLYPPTYGDSMVYHLARVEHWIQNRSVAFFATHYLTQIEFTPLSEYNLAHLHLLSGTDRFDACMPLLAALVCIIGVSELARLLGASRSTQIAASVICATIPAGVLLATITEDDYFAAATGVGLLVILASFSLGNRWGYRAIALGAAMGLCYMAQIQHGRADGSGRGGLARGRCLPAGANRGATGDTASGDQAGPGHWGEHYCGCRCLSGPDRATVRYICRSRNERPNQLASNHCRFWSQCRPLHGSQLPYWRRGRRDPNLRQHGRVGRTGTRLFRLRCLHQ